MKHPTSIELVDYRKEKLPPERAQEIEEHLSVCDSCLQAWEELEAVESHLAAWEDPPVSETFAANAIQTIMYKEATHALNLTGDLNDGWRGNLWFRRIVLTAGAVAATLLFQVLVWNPLATPSTFRTILNLVPTAFAHTSEQAVPDTVLVLTLNSDNTFSTSLLTGQYELEDLITELSDLVEKGRFKKLLIVGTDVDNPVTFRTEKLQPLLEKLEIDSFMIGTGVVALETAGELTATIALPLNLDVSHFHFSPDSLYQFSSDSLLTGYVSLDTIDYRVPYVDSFYSPTPIYSQSVGSFISLPVASLYFGDPLYTSPLEFLSPIIDFTILQPQSFLSPFSLEIKAHRLGLDPSVRVTPGRVRARTRVYPDEVLLADLLSPSQAILTVNTDGSILFNRAVVPERELERALRRLRLLNPRISLLILVREEAGSDDPGYKVMEIAKRLGMSVSIKKVRDP